MTVREPDLLVNMLLDRVGAVLYEAPRGTRLETVDCIPGEGWTELAQVPGRWRREDKDAAVRSLAAKLEPEDLGAGDGLWVCVVPWMDGRCGVFPWTHPGLKLVGAP